MNLRIKKNRFNLNYLSHKYFWLIVICTLWGLALGFSYYTFFEDTVYQTQARAEVNFSNGEKANYNTIKDLAKSWNEIFSSLENQKLLTMNLRYNVKNSLLENNKKQLTSKLAEFKKPKTFIITPKIYQYFPNLAKKITISKYDLVSALDFQSLAKIISNLQPLPEKKEWKIDSSKLNVNTLEQINGFDKNDPFFTIFFQVYQLRNQGSETYDPYIAWKSAVDEVTERLINEIDKEGSGYFSKLAKEELLKELQAIPVLVENGIYKLNIFNSYTGPEKEYNCKHWQNIWNKNIIFSTEPRTISKVDLTLNYNLKPWFFPEDNEDTHINQIVINTAWLFINSRYSQKSLTINKEEEQQVKAPIPNNEISQNNSSNNLQSPIKDSRKSDEEIENLNELLRIKNNAIEENTFRINVEEEKLAKLIDINKQIENSYRLSEQQVKDITTEIVNKQKNSKIVEVDLEKLSLKQQLAVLLESCTEEHPFVKEVRKKILALEIKQQEINSLKKEKDNTSKLLEKKLLAEKKIVGYSNSLKDLAEQQQKVNTAIRQYKKNITTLQNDINNISMELETKIRNNQNDTSINILTSSINKLTSDIVKLSADEKNNHKIVIIKDEENERAQPVLDKKLEHIYTSALEKNKNSIYLGLVAGIILSFVIITIKEVTKNTFNNIYEAEYLLDIPVIGEIQTYNNKKIKQLAKKYNATLIKNKFGVTYIPLPIEEQEPPVIREGIKEKRFKISLWGLMVDIFLIITATLIIVLNIFELEHNNKDSSNKKITQQYSPSEYKK